MGFDRAAAIRRIKPQRRVPSLHRRPDAELPFVTDQQAAGREVLLDTTVYIHVLQGKTPLPIDRLLQTRIINHSSVALAELTHLCGALDPHHPGTANVLKRLGQTIDDIRPYRLHIPSIRVAGEAGMLAGLLTRVTHRPNERALLNDATLFLQAAELGCDLLTGNIQDFDGLDQLIPGTGLRLYRATP